MTAKRLLSKRLRHQNYISPDAWVVTAIKRMNNDNVGALVVSSDGEEIEGIISERDIIRGLNKFGSRVLKFTVQRLMTNDVITSHMSESVHGIVKKMINHKVSHIPVVNDKNYFEGIINIRDVLLDNLEGVEVDTTLRSVCVTEMAT